MTRRDLEKTKELLQRIVSIRMMPKRAHAYVCKCVYTAILFTMYLEISHKVQN